MGKIVDDYHNSVQNNSLSKDIFRTKTRHTDICMDKMSGQSFGNLKVKNYWKLITTYVITRILTLCPGNSIYVHANALTECQPIFSKVISHTAQY